MTSPAASADNFYRADTTSGLGPNWTAQAGTFGINNNTAYPAAGSWAMSTWVQPLGHDDMEVAVTLAAVAGAGGLWAAVLGSNTAGQTMFLVGGYSDGSLALYTGQSWAENAASNVTFQFGAGISTVGAGDTVGLRRTNSRPFEATYQVMVNGDPFGEPWIDSTGVMPIDSDHRVVGLGLLLNSPADYQLVESWAAIDLATAVKAQPVPLAMPCTLGDLSRWMQAAIAFAPGVDYTTTIVSTQSGISFL
jgi:hypothetical protein